MTAVALSLSKIRTDGGTQSRAAINPSMVSEYAEILDSLPPITVFHDGTDYWLVDGFHRMQAALSAGAMKISADVHQGSQRKAVLYSCSANAMHGMRRTNEDKRRAVATLLRDEEWAAKSDRWIAEAARVSTGLVAELRPASSGADSITCVPKRSGKDGKEYAPRKPRPAPDGVSAEPSATQALVAAVATPVPAAAPAPAGSTRWAPPASIPELIAYLGEWFDDGPLRQIVTGLTDLVPEPLPVDLAAKVTQLRLRLRDATCRALAYRILEVVPAAATKPAVPAAVETPDAPVKVLTVTSYDDDRPPDDA